MRKRLIWIVEIFFIAQFVISAVPFILPMFSDSLYDVGGWIGYAIGENMPFGYWFLLGTLGVAVSDDTSLFWCLAIYAAILLINIVFIPIAYKTQKVWVYRLFKWPVYILLGLDIFIKVIALLEYGFIAYGWCMIVSAIIPIVILIMLVLALDKTNGTVLDQPINVSRL